MVQGRTVVIVTVIIGPNVAESCSFKKGARPSRLELRTTFDAQCPVLRVWSESFQVDGSSRIWQVA